MNCAISASAGRAGVERDDDLVGGIFLEFLQLGVDRVERRRVEHVGLVGDIAVRLRRQVFVLGERGRLDQQREKKRDQQDDQPPLCSWHRHGRAPTNAPGPWQARRWKYC